MMTILVMYENDYVPKTKFGNKLFFLCYLLGYSFSTEDLIVILRFFDLLLFFSLDFSWALEQSFKNCFGKVYICLAWMEIMFQSIPSEISRVFLYCCHFVQKSLSKQLKIFSPILTNVCEGVEVCILGG